ncbi:Versicolorin B synthase 2 [Paramyrothecium foliicola]|nr:Versicolorin B synthase 2 [Paramyrothecium foliicola]
MAAQDLESPFDYIIAGGGTAGLVLASRLSEDGDVRVLVVEAGGDRGSDPLVLTPGLTAATYGKDEYDWNFISPPQPTLSNRQVNQARGKCLGGSSAINFMLALYPSRHNIDSWAKLGNKGWDYDSLAPYFRKSGTVHDPNASTRDICGMTYHDESLMGDGPVQVSFGEGFSSVNTAWMAAFAKFGLKMTADPRTGKAMGAFQNGATIDPTTKTRSFSQTAYLGAEVLQRQNLAVLTDTLVTKILLEKQDSGDVVAIGISTRDKDGSEKTFRASREVILAAGTLQSPQLLEVSGIGGRALLESLDIPVLVDNPNVGEHLQDHPIVCQSFEVNDKVPSGDVLRDPNVMNALIGQYTATRDGPMGQSTISSAYTPLTDGNGVVSREVKESILNEALPKVETSQKLPATERETELLRETILTEDEPVFQHLLFPSQITIKDQPASMAEYLIPSLPENYMTVMTMLNHPFSRGSCHITSSNINVKPTWDPKYNANPVDLELLAHGVQFVERLVKSEPLNGIFKADGARQPLVKADSLENAREVVRQRQISVFHPTSSCAMLPKELGGVVDERLCVYGTKGLRIVDASVVPLEPLGNIVTTVYAVAEKAADLIKEDRK